MLKTVGRRGWAWITARSRSVGGSAQPLWNSCRDGGVAADRSEEGLRLGILGPFSQQSRSFVGGCGGVKDLPSCFVRETTQVWNGGLLTGSSAHDPRAFQYNPARGFVQLKTKLEVADNSGAKQVECIKVMKGSNAAKIGDIIMASVKEAQPRAKVKKGDVVTCVVVRAATQKLRRDGSEIRFDKNAVVLVNKAGEPIGTRVFGPVPHELRRRKMLKILALAEYVL